MSKYQIATKTITVNTSEYTLRDCRASRVVSVKFLGLDRALILWQGAAYDAAGDYTQDAVDARIAELLGSDPRATLQAMADAATAVV